MMAWIVFEIIVNLFQACLIVYFLKKQLHGMRINILADSACILCMAAWYSSYLFYDIPVIDTVGFVIPLVYGCIMFKDRRSLVLFWVIVIAIVFSGVANLVISFYTGILGIGLDDIMSKTTSRMVFIISSNLALLLTVLVITKIHKSNLKHQDTSFIPLFLLNALCLAAIETLFIIGRENNLKEEFSFACICLFAISILSIVLYELAAYNAHKQQEYRIEIERLTMSYKYSKEMQNIYASISAFRHDLKHQMQTISQMVAGNNAIEVSRYCDEISQNLNDIQPFSTGNIAVDSLLTAKVSMIKTHHISFDFDPCPLVELPINESAFCALLGNILDNAIEGIDRLSSTEEYGITLSFSRTWDMFYIICKNPYNDETVRRANGVFLSAKNTGNHGIGTRSIQATAEKAGGYVRYALRDGVFCIEVILPYNKDDR